MQQLYLTAPNSAPSHSFFNVSTVLSGNAAPVFLNVSNPASRSTKENLSPSELGRASRILLPAGITSRPMPSPGIRPIELLTDFDDNRIIYTHQYAMSAPQLPSSMINCRNLTLNNSCSEKVLRQTRLERHRRRVLRVQLSRTNMIKLT